MRNFTATILAFLLLAGSTAVAQQLGKQLEFEGVIEASDLKPTEPVKGVHPSGFRLASKGQTYELDLELLRTRMFPRDAEKSRKAFLNLTDGLKKMDGNTVKVMGSQKTVTIDGVSVSIIKMSGLIPGRNMSPQKQAYRERSAKAVAKIIESLKQPLSDGERKSYREAIGEDSPYVDADFRLKRELVLTSFHSSFEPVSNGIETKSASQFRYTVGRDGSFRYEQITSKNRVVDSATGQLTERQLALIGMLLTQEKLLELPADVPFDEWRNQKVQRDKHAVKFGGFSTSYLTNGATVERQEAKKCSATYQRAFKIFKSLSTQVSLMKPKRVLRSPQKANNTN